MGTRRWHEIKKLSFFFKLGMFPLNYSHFYVQNQIFAWIIMRFQKKIYLNPTNGSKVMQDYRNHAPSGFVSLFGRGGVRLGSNYLFLAFLICTDSHSKKMHWKDFGPNFPFMIIWLSRRIYFWEFFPLPIFRHSVFW